MNDVIQKQKEIVGTKDIKVVLAWLKDYHSLDEDVKEDNPLFCMNGIEFDYFDDGDRMDSRYDLNPRGSDSKSVDFDDLVEMGLDEYIKSLNLKVDEVYQTDVNYNYEIIVRSDILDEFKQNLENQVLNEVELTPEDIQSQFLKDNPELENNYEENLALLEKEARREKMKNTSTIKL